MSNVFMAAMVKSGSTHIEMGLSALLGYRNENLVRIDGEGQGEQNINPFKLQLLACRDNQIIGGHHCAYGETILWLKQAGWKPVVLMRNLYDTMVSGKEQLDAGGGFNVCLPPLYVPYAWSVWDDESKYVWLAHHYGQWQIKFAASWIDYVGDKMVITYDEFFKDQASGFRRIVEFYGIPANFDPVTLRKVIEFKGGRFNKGTMGRGESLVPRKAKRILDDIVGSWGGMLSKQIRKELY